MRLPKNGWGKVANELEQAGPGFIADLADAPIYKFALEKIAAFDQANDPNVACGYFHRLRLGNEMRWLYVHKVLLNDCSYLNIAYRLDQLGRPGKIIAQTLGDNLVSEVGWQRFQSLTKREKQILLLIADGRETSQIADELFISKATAKTHRRNMMNKIEARNLIEALRFADALKLLGVQVF
ncbi:MAG: LuxR family transcriptional regulator [Owenweeksia sp.]|nr:LuxR family transcriptional regulator [Owenweeksia sp.]